LSEGNAYFQMHATRPQTIAYSLTDSPIGLLAWIVDKFNEWTHGPLDRAVDRDEVLTNVMFYWLTGTAGSAARLYYENMHTDGDWNRQASRIPVGVAAFAEDIAIRRYGEQGNNIVHWADFPRGGHFAALEAPDLLVGDIRAFFREIRRK
jgi:pimeloyl-ACP methyl ester carboxylesterase